ncbi:CBO0543 family protein [Neobacillus rhizosphaerae]|uniref:CBO0543 family protein n=1 Tax=Neobacillus rhizosphaerae TaxID=2880965 RepID=UPI003D28513D
MHIVLNALFLLAGIKWGDWKNWKAYYSTILFFIGGDLLKNSLLHNHRMWSYQEVYFGQQFLIGHMAINLMIAIIVYPATILIYLGHFPRSIKKQILWVSLWVFLYSGIEGINFYFLNLINYDHNWNLLWSIFFNIVMFTVLRVHFLKPLLAWAISIIWMIFLWNWFNVPMNVFK